MVKLYVEGGGDSNGLRTACRKGFTTFLTKAGLKNRPRIVACGGRQNAFEDYCTAIKNGEDAILLVDSEDPVLDQHCQGQQSEWNPWEHLRTRPGDGWRKPAKVADTDCHLMTQCMESWLLADRETLKSFFGQGFKDSQLPAPNRSPEGIRKAEVYQALARATKDCKTKNAYGKGEHSFLLLELLDAQKVVASSPWAERFIKMLKNKLDEA